MMPVPTVPRSTLSAPALVMLAVVTALAACSPGGEATSPRAPLEAVREIPSPAPPGSAEPNLTAADGRVLLSWLQREDGDAHALRFAEYTGEGWTGPRTIVRGEDFFANWADFPSLSVHPEGWMAAHWLQRSGEGTYDYDVRIATSTDGGESWSAPVTPHRDGTRSEHGFVSFVPEPDGRLSAVWLDGRDYAAREHGDEAAEMQLRHTTVSPGAGLGEETLLDGRVCDCCQTAAVLTSAGPVVVYRDRSPEEVRDIHVVRRVDGAWTEPRPVHRDGWTIPGCPVNGPSVAADGARVAVAWFTGADETPRVQLAFSEDAGASWGSPVRIDDGAPLGRVAVLLLEDGGALVSWMEESGEEAELRVRRVSAAGEPGPAAAVSPMRRARGSGFPRMVRSGSRVVFAWTEPGEQPSVRTAVAELPGR